jgi:hypothetical protein
VDTITATYLPAALPVISGTLSFCQTDSTTLDAGLFEGYIWSNGKVTRTITVKNAANYSVTVTNAAGCKGSASVSTIVYPTSVGGTISSDTTVCAGTNSATLKLNGQTGSVVKWQFMESTDRTAIFWTDLPGATSTSFTATNLTTSTDYRVIVKSGTCSEAVSSTATVTVEFTPINGVLTKSPDVDSVCDGADVWATFTTGSGGNGVDVVKYRTRAGGTWSLWLPYDQEHSILTNGKSEAQIIIYRAATSCPV